MDFIADGITTNLVYGRNNTISEIATMLNIADTNKLNLFNGVVKIEGKRTAVYIYNNNTNSYRKLGSILTATNNNFGKDWDVEIEGVTQDGIRVKHIENIKGEWNSEIPLGISHIERFDGGVNNLKIPMSVKTLGEGCFSEVDDLHKVIFDKGVKTIPNSCFRYSSINSVVFSGCEQEIGEYAFDSCDKLSGALVTNAVNIKARAFCDTALTLVNLCKIEEIGIEAFAYCQKLRRVKLSNNLRVIKAGAFRYCKDLDCLFIPSSVEIIDKLAFEGCSKLREVKMSHNTRVFNNTFPKNTKVIYY